MRTLTLPKRKPEPIQAFKRQWYDHLSEVQLAELINRFGNRVDDIVRVQLRVELKNGHAKILGNPDVRVTVHFRK